MSHLIKYTPWLFSILLTLPVFGQLTSDSSKKLPDYKIKWSKVDYKDGRKTIINCVEPPIIKATPKKIISAEESAEIVEKWKAKRQKIKESGGFATVSATVYDHKITYVRLWFEQKNCLSLCPMMTFILMICRLPSIMQRRKNEVNSAK